jgi:hypothetical protein
MILIAIESIVVRKQRGLLFATKANSTFDPKEMLVAKLA